MSQEIRLRELPIDPLKSQHFVVFNEPQSAARALSVRLASSLAFDYIIAVTDDCQSKQVWSDAGIPLFVYQVQTWDAILPKLKQIPRSARVLLLIHHSATPADVFEWVHYSVTILDPTVAPVSAIPAAPVWLVPSVYDYSLYPVLVALPWALNARDVHQVLQVLPKRTFITHTLTHYVNAKPTLREKIPLPRELVTYQRTLLRDPQE